MKRKERGSTLVYVALSMVIILGMLALAVDVGIGYVQRRKARTAADAAGLAAVSLMAQHVTSQEIYDTLEAYVIANGAELDEAMYVDVNGDSLGDLATSSDPPAGATGIQVEASASADTYFAGVFQVLSIGAGSGYEVGPGTPTPTVDPLATTEPITVTWHMTASAVSVAQYQPLDILLVMDISGSMDDDSEDMDLPWVSGYGQYQYQDWVYQETCDYERVCQWVRVGRRWQQVCDYEYVCHDDWVEVWKTVREEPLGQAQDAARYFVSLNDAELTRIGLASYSTSAWLNLHLSDNFSSVNSAIGGLTADGWTNTGGGMSVAYNELDSNGRANAKKVIILLSDGVANCDNRGRCGDSYNYAAEIYALGVAENALDDGYLIYTIALGTFCDEAFMRDLAGASDRYFYAPDASELQSVYEEIFANIQFRLSL